MSRFALLYDIKYALSHGIELDSLLAALFADHPDLKTVEYSVTSEYDDNNYSDYSRLQKVNGWQVDYDGNYDEDYEDEEDNENNPPKASEAAVSAAMLISEFVQERFGFGDHTFSRDEFADKSDPSPGDNPQLECAIALLHSKKVPLKTLIEAGGRWVVRHAQVHGKYGPEDEFKLFAKEGMMYLALEYAKECGPLSEKTLNWFVLSSNKENPDHDHLQEYLKWMKAA